MPLITAKTVTGRSDGRVTYLSRAKRLAPSIFPASYRVGSMPCNPARKMIMVPPTPFQVESTMIQKVIQKALSCQLMAGWPAQRRIVLKRPLVGSRKAFHICDVMANETTAGRYQMVR